MKYIVKKTCTVCGKEFEGATSSKYCGDECRGKAYLEASERYKEDAKIRKRISRSRQKRNQQNHKLAEIEKVARAAGMSYAEYQKQETLERMARRV